MGLREAKRGHGNQNGTTGSKTELWEPKRSHGNQNGATGSKTELSFLMVRCEVKGRRKGEEGEQMGAVNTTCWAFRIVFYALKAVFGGAQFSTKKKTDPKLNKDGNLISYHIY